MNVHPAKREVRFRSEPAVRSFVIRAVLARLRELGAGEAPAPAAGGAGPVAAPVPNAPVVSLPPPLSGALPVAAFRPPAAPVVTRPAFAAPVPPAPLPAAAPTLAAPPAGTAVRWRLLGLAHGSLAVFETAAGLVLLDRRAAQERVFFEELQAQFRVGGAPSQRLLLPIPVELDPIASALLLDRQRLLRDCGFEVAEFGRNLFRIEAVPSWLEPGGAEAFLRDFVGLVREGRLPEGRPDLAREEVARLATAKALRLTDNPNETELRALVARLFATEHPLTSPAGRPTFVELSQGELARRFQKLT